MLLNQNAKLKTSLREHWKWLDCSSKQNQNTNTMKTTIEITDCRNKYFNGKSGFVDIENKTIKIGRTTYQLQSNERLEERSIYLYKKGESYYFTRIESYTIK